MNPHAVKALRAQRCESELVLRAAELAFHGGTAAVQNTPLVCVPRDARVVPSRPDDGTYCCSALTARSGMIAAQSRSSHSA